MQLFSKINLVNFDVEAMFTALTKDECINCTKFKTVQENIILKEEQNYVSDEFYTQTCTFLCTYFDKEILGKDYIKLTIHETVC